MKTYILFRLFEGQWVESAQTQAKSRRAAVEAMISEGDKQLWKIRAAT